jgi:hypothetical protein
MVIRYVRERGYKGNGRDPLLTIGKAYIALGIVFRPAPHASQVCICTDTDGRGRLQGEAYADGGPGLFDLNCFEVVDPRVPPEWSMLDHGNGFYRLDPTEFTGDFWDRYHEADPNAEATFEFILSKLAAFHPDHDSPKI